jgi:hypothetical protein
MTKSWRSSSFAGPAKNTGSTPEPILFIDRDGTNGRTDPRSPSTERKGLAFHQIAGALRVHGRDQTSLRRALKVMEGAARCSSKGRLFPAAGQGCRQGEFLPSSRGFGFVKRSSGGGRTSSCPRAYPGALAGDTVEVVVQEKGKIGKPEGRIVPHRQEIAGDHTRLYQEHYGRPMILPFRSASAILPCPRGNPEDLSA